MVSCHAVIVSDQSCVVLSHVHDMLAGHQHTAYFYPKKCHDATTPSMAPWDATIRRGVMIFMVCGCFLLF